MLHDHLCRQAVGLHAAGNLDVTLVPALSATLIAAFLAAFALGGVHDVAQVAVVLVAVRTGSLTATFSKSLIPCASVFKKTHPEVE